jgi:hypothetical protein
MKIQEPQRHFWLSPEKFAFYECVFLQYSLHSMAMFINIFEGICFDEEICGFKSLLI